MKKLNNLKINNEAIETYLSKLNENEIQTLIIELLQEHILRDEFEYQQIFRDSELWEKSFGKYKIGKIVEILHNIPKDKFENIEKSIYQVREELLKDDNYRKEIEKKIVNIYQNTECTSGRVAEMLGQDKEYVREVLYNNDIDIYDISPEELEEQVKNFEKKFNKKK